MARKKYDDLTCTVEFTEGAVDRITQAFADLYYQIQDGIYKWPETKMEKTKDETA